MGAALVGELHSFQVVSTRQLDTVSPARGTAIECISISTAEGLRWALGDYISRARRSAPPATRDVTVAKGTPVTRHTQIRVLSAGSLDGCRSSPREGGSVYCTTLPAAER